LGLIFGYSPGQALACATRIGAELMDMGDELGQVREGYLADLLLVDGDPLADVSILQRRKRLVAIMQIAKRSCADTDARQYRRWLTPFPDVSILGARSLRSLRQPGGLTEATRGLSRRVAALRRPREHRDYKRSR
jgi:Amidohydrolase family